MGSFRNRYSLLLTELERIRLYQINMELKQTIDSIILLSQNFGKILKYKIFYEISNCINKIKIYLNQPFSQLPDLNLWLLCNKKPIGVCSIRSSDVAWSGYDKREMGFLCNKMFYTNLKVYKIFI